MLSKDDKLRELISSLEASVPDPSTGLPEEVFLFVSRITPLVNVDLLIQDESGNTLLTWRDDKYCGSGWHVPGGIIRHRETMANRIHAVARLELGAAIDTDGQPLSINEIIKSDMAERAFYLIFVQVQAPSTTR